MKFNNTSSGRLVWQISGVVNVWCGEHVDVPLLHMYLFTVSSLPNFPGLAQKEGSCLTFSFQLGLALKKLIS